VSTGTVSTGTVSTETVSTAVVRAANAQPDEWQLGEAGTRFQTPARISAAGAGAAGAGGALMATGFGLCLASALVAGGTWRRKLGTSGSRILLPSAITMIVGLIPRLIVPGSLIRLPAADAAASLPALAEYLRFAFSTLSGGFLTAGLIGVGIGTLLVSIQRIVPPSEDEEDEGYA
ncbi:MAG: hypothetical protein JXM71_11405, partial [Spirochaetales bacterium]|nr:hypothetical protein [Spirochaetales bacterium]